MGKTDLTPHVERGETQQLEVVVPDGVEDGDAELQYSRNVWTSAPSSLRLLLSSLRCLVMSPNLPGKPHPPPRRPVRKARPWDLAVGLEH